MVTCCVERKLLCWPLVAQACIQFRLSCIRFRCCRVATWAWSIWFRLGLLSVCLGYGRPLPQRFSILGSVVLVYGIPVSVSEYVTNFFDVCLFYLHCVVLICVLFRPCSHKSPLTVNAVILATAFILVIISQFLLCCLFTIFMVFRAFVLHDIHLFSCQPEFSNPSSGSHATWIDGTIWIAYFSTLKGAILKRKFILITMELCCLMTVWVCVIHLYAHWILIVILTSLQYLYCLLFFWIICLIRSSIDNSLIVIIRGNFIVFRVSVIVAVHVLMHYHIIWIMGVTYASSNVVSSWVRSPSTSWIFIINIYALTFGICLLNSFNKPIV